MQITSLEIQSAIPPALLDRGCVNVIGFDAIKARAGQRWPKLREGVVIRLESLLRHALRPTDFFAPLNDSAYLITMPGADPEDVTVVCLRIAYDLHKNLLGHCDLGQIQVSLAKDGGDHRLSLEPLARHVVSVLAERAGIHDLGHGAAAHLSEVQAPCEGLLHTSHNYIPIWDSRNQAITTYLCNTRALRMSGAHEEPVLLQQLTGRDRAMVELSALQRAIADLEEALTCGRRVLLGIPLTFEMIGSPFGRMQLASICRRLPAEHRQYLLFVLTEVPRGVAHTRLADIVNTLRPFARSIMTTVAPGSRWFTAYQGIGLQAIGMRAAQCIAGSRIEADMSRLTNGACSARLGSFLYDIISPDVLEIAQRKGVRWLSGPVLGSAVPSPMPMTRLSWDEIAGGRPKVLASA